MVPTLIEFNERKMFPKVKEGTLYIEDDNGETHLPMHQGAVTILHANNIDLQQFNNIIITNYEKFEFI